MMKQPTKTSDKLIRPSGLTLFELVVVLAIISAMVVVVLPFCKRSNDGLNIRQAGSSIAQAIRYAIDLSEKQNKVVRFIYQEKHRSYQLQIVDGENIFKPMDDFTGTERFLNEDMHLLDVEGFEQSGPEYLLTLDPQRSRPDAWISFSTNDVVVTIRINRKNVAMEEKGI